MKKLKHTFSQSLHFIFLARSRNHTFSPSSLSLSHPHPCLRCDVVQLHFSKKARSCPYRRILFRISGAFPLEKMRLLELSCLMDQICQLYQQLSFVHRVFWFVCFFAFYTSDKVEHFHYALTVLFASDSHNKAKKRYRTTHIVFISPCPETGGKAPFVTTLRHVHELFCSFYIVKDQMTFVQSAGAGRKSTWKRQINNICDSINHSGAKIIRVPIVLYGLTS